jgi:hypothetical protein
MLPKTRLVLVGVIVAVAVSSLLLMTSQLGPLAVNEGIEITRTLVGDWSGPAIQYGMSGLITVHNLGSLSVEIVMITVQKVSYSYSPTRAAGKFSASTNRIGPGESLTFKITCDPTTPIVVSDSAYVNWMVVTRNGAVATIREPQY